VTIDAGRARTRMSTSSSPGIGTAVRRVSSTSGPPGAVMNTASCSFGTVVSGSVSFAIREGACIFRPDQRGRV
jgi:hypothetical protein